MKTYLGMPSQAEWQAVQKELAELRSARDDRQLAAEQALAVNVPAGFRWRGVGEWLYGPKAPDDVNAEALYVLAAAAPPPSTPRQHVMGASRPTSKHVECLQEKLDELGLTVDGEEALDIFAAVFSKPFAAEQRFLSNVIQTRTERAAKAVYDLIPFDGEGQKPAWVKGGNSKKQEEARRYARAVLCTTAFAMAKGEE